MLPKEMIELLIFNNEKFKDPKDSIKKDTVPITMTSYKFSLMSKMMKNFLLL